MNITHLQTEITASKPQGEPLTDLANLLNERDELVTRNKLLSKYIREKTDHLLQVMGTLPLRPEELDDNTLISVDPIGIVTESFEQVMEHLQNTNDALASTRDEIKAIFDSAGAGIVVVNDKMERVAVNLSAKQFRDPSLIETIGASLQRSSLPPHLLELELTESMLIENIITTRSKLKILKDKGITLAIDDFGTSYSSLSYLRHFPIDRLKIDKSFVQEINEKSGDSAAIVEAIIALSHSLGLSVIAEGVENQDQVSFLLKRSCHELQGFYFSQPLLPEDLEELLACCNNGVDFCLYHYS